MKQNYFIYDGKQYNKGDKIIINFFDVRAGKSYMANAKFLYYDSITAEYHIEVYGKEYVYAKNDFYKNLRNTISSHAPTVNAYDINCKKHTFVNELSVDGMLIAWIWYVFIMAVGVIFYDRIGIWILASVIFFNYRNKKLKEAGYK